MSMNVLTNIQKKEQLESLRDHQTLILWQQQCLELREEIARTKEQLVAVKSVLAQKNAMNVDQIEMDRINQ